MNKYTNFNDIGIFLKKSRIEQGLSQEELAGISGCGRRLISDIEKGKTTVQAEKLFNVISALGLTISIEEKWKVSHEKNT